MYGTLEVGNYAVNVKGSKYFKESNHRDKQKIEKDYIIEQMKLKQKEMKVKQNEKV
jgi:hypothetical protein